jgi:hypothetical protein
MGLVHTAIRSKLAVDKVRKTTIVGMDIKRSHLEAGLVRSRGHRNFEAPTSTDWLQETDANDFDTGDFEDVLDFEQLTEQLIEDAAAEINSDSDTEDDELLPPALPLTIRLSLHAIRSALPDPPPPQPANAAPKTAILLKSLFIFPTSRDSPSPGIDYFWKGGIENLDKEMEAYEILCSGQEGSGETDTGIPV